MSNDMSDVLNNIKNMINKDNIPENLKDILNNFSQNNSNDSSNSNNTHNTNNLKNQNSEMKNGDNNSENSNNFNVTPEMINNISTILNSASNNNRNNENHSSNNSQNNFNIDINTILKMKSIIDAMNTKDDPRANLLYSLKPYMRQSRQEKLDQYVNLLNMTKIADIMKSDKKENSDNVS